jgi:rod shape-determining protein MreD
MTDRFVNIAFHQARWLVIFSYFVGITLDTMLVLNSANLYLPPFTLLLLLYWCAQFLKQTHFISAFILGLLLDALYQTTLGAHALLFIVVTFIMLRYRLLFRSHSVLQQALVIFFYLYAYQLLSFVILAPVLQSDAQIAYWLMPFSCLLIWPVLALCLRWLTQRLIRA